MHSKQHYMCQGVNSLWRCTHRTGGRKGGRFWIKRIFKTFFFKSVKCCFTDFLLFLQILPQHAMQILGISLYFEDKINFKHYCGRSCRIKWVLTKAVLSPCFCTFWSQMNLDIGSCGMFNVGNLDSITCCFKGVMYGFCQKHLSSLSTALIIDCQLLCQKFVK